MLSALIAMMAQTATGAAPLAPSGKWTVDYADSMCVLQRDFGEGDAKMTFALQPNGLRGEGMMVVLARAEAGGNMLRRGRADVAFDRDEGTTIDFKRFRVAAHRMTITQFSLSPAEIERLTQARAMTVPLDASRSVELSLDNIRGAVRALDTCQNDLLESFGVPRAELDAVVVAAEPVAGQGYWLTWNDYPVDALRQNKQGDTLIVWRIAADGRLSDCRVVKSANFASLDAAACFLLTRRAHYRPARDAAGEAVPSWNMRRVIWRLPS